MSEAANIRKERVTRLLDELRYEIERGMIEGHIDEHIVYRFYVPISKTIPNGVVFCEFRTRPIVRHLMSPDDLQPRLKLVKG